MQAGRSSTMRARYCKTRTKPSPKRARWQAQSLPNSTLATHRRQLPKILRAFQIKMSNVHVKLHDWSHNAILTGIRDGRLQLGLIVPPLKASALHELHYE